MANSAVPHIRYMRLSDVEKAFAKRNPRRHDVPAIAASIKARGFNAPPLLNEKTKRLVYGHGRTKALRYLFDQDPDATPERIARDTDGEWKLPVLRGVSFKTRHEAEEYLVADNRIAELASWEPAGIAAILEKIRGRGKLEGTGYVARDVDSMLRGLRRDRDLVEPPIPDVPDDPVTKLGDVWAMGAHRLTCGDSTGQRFEGCDVLIYDPQWDKAPIVFREFPSVLAFSDGGRFSDVGELFGAPAWVYVWDCVTSWYTPNRPLRRAKFCMWYGDISRYNFDGAHYGVNDSPTRTVSNTRGSYQFTPDSRGKHLSDVFSRGIVQEHADGLHKHSKPVDWMRLLIGNCTQGDIADPFCGSGSAVMAAEQLGRRVHAREICPAYCDVIVQRWEKLTGQKAVLSKPAKSQSKSGAARHMTQDGMV